MGCLIDLAEELSIVNRKAAWYSYEGNNIGNGRDKAMEWLKDNPDKAAEIEEMIKMMTTTVKDVEKGE
jgi:recombination protein RecA